MQLAALKPELKAQLVADTKNAIACAVFGVPTFRADGELFWGGDRVDALIRHLQGERIDENTLANFLARPPLAKRRR